MSTRDRKIFRHLYIIHYFCRLVLRDKLIKDIHRFQNILTQYFEYTDAELSEEANALLPQIKLHINKAANFASFKRWIIRNNDVFMAKFGQYLD